MIGIGTDIVQVARIRDLLDKFGDRFPQRILAEKEYRDFVQLKVGREAFLAKRFAAKEAVAKALGKGIGEFISFTDIEVTHNTAGKPEILFSLEGSELARSLGMQACHVSIADEKDYAVAFVVLI